MKAHNEMGIPKISKISVNDRIAYATMEKGKINKKMKFIQEGDRWYLDITGTEEAKALQQMMVKLEELTRE